MLEGWDDLYPHDGGLNAQVRPYSETLSAFKVMKDRFFGDGGTEVVQPEGWDDVGDGGSGCVGDGGSDG